MKKIILAATALASVVALSSTARAADVIVSGYDWTGFYLGANAGVAWNNSEVDNEINYDGTNQAVIDQLGDWSDKIEGDQAAFTGGLMLGYNWQMDQIVLGAEADINYLGFSDDSNNEYADILGPNYRGVNASHDLSFEANWFGTLRGRLGFAVDNMLFYGTGGLAYGHMEADSDFKISAGDDVLGKWDGSADSVNWGWTVGAGMEYGIENWSLGVEYLFVDLGDAEWDADLDGPGTELVDLDNASSDASVDYQFSVVRATAKLRF